ncbi:MAG TPA: Yip1 family protein [Thermoanaerobaculia bacterium]|nr:Yip1 family protein [Thermoanaerobaculia bacterium]
MTTAAGESAVPDAGPLNSFQRLVGVLFSPIETFRDIARRPDWIIPIIVITLTTLASYMVVAPHLDLESTFREQMEARGVTDQQLIDKQLEMMKKVTRFNAPITAIVIPLMMLAMAGVLLLAFKLMGYGGTFKQFFSVSSYSFVPQILKGIVTSIIVASRGMLTQPELVTLIKSNLGFLVELKTSPAAFAFLSSFDVFNIWMVVLLIIGLSFAAKVTMRQSTVMVLILWSLMILIKVGIAALTGGAGS